MPNWVDNRLIITAEEKTLKSIRDKIKVNENNQPELAKSLYPIPKDEEENWYEWNIANYGSKWPDCYTEVRNLNHHKQLYFAFESAWAPLHKLAQRISADYKCKVVLKHYSMDNMAEGTIKWDEGLEYFYLHRDIDLKEIYPEHILQEEEE
tara:strand:- start:288 stop:740 length:453 start_codon:yes stop_codon:yes gene_type:complete